MKGLTTHFLRWVHVFVSLCRCYHWRLLCSSYWIDTLVLKNWGKYLRYYCCITLSYSRENQRSAQEVARMISGAVAGEVFAQIKTYQVPITNSSPSHLHYLPFASRFPLAHFTLAILFALSFSFASFSLACRLLVCWIACLSRWLKIILNCVTSPTPTTMIF